MPRVFNVIRKKMLNSNRVSKYLLNAIGEVVLVVIGVSLVVGAVQSVLTICGPPIADSAQASWCL